MKTYFLPIILITFSSLLYSCSKKEIELKTDDIITLHHNETYQIVAKSKTNINYSSSNLYNAEVNGTGLITARFVGKTTIHLQNDYDERDLQIIVEPQHHLYPQPNIEFGESKSSIVNKYGEPTISSDDELLYDNYGMIGFKLIVTFDENNCVKSFMVVVPTIYNEILTDFLTERYMYIGYQNQILIFINGLTTADATMAIGAKLFSTEYWIITHIPIKDSKSAFPDDTTLNQITSILK